MRESRAKNDLIKKGERDRHTHEGLREAKWRKGGSSLAELSVYLPFAFMSPLRSPDGYTVQGAAASHTRDCGETSVVRYLRVSHLTDRPDRRTCALPLGRVREGGLKGD